MKVRKSMLYYYAMLAVVAAENLSDSTKLMVLDELSCARKIAEFSEEREEDKCESVSD